MRRLLSKNDILHELARVKHDWREFTYVTVESDFDGEIALTFAYDGEDGKELWDVWVGDKNNRSFSSQQDARAYYHLIRFLWENIGRKFKDFKHFSDWLKE